MFKSTSILGLTCISLIACTDVNNETNANHHPDQMPPIHQATTPSDHPDENAMQPTSEADAKKGTEMAKKGLNIMGEMIQQASDSAKQTYDSTDFKEIGSNIADKSTQLYQQAKNSDAVNTTEQLAEDLIDKSKNLYQEAKESDGAKQAAKATDQVIEKSKQVIEYIKDKASNLQSRGHNLGGQRP